MAKRHPNYRLVKINRNYTVEEVSARLQVHRNTVREWIKQGLPVVDTKRPILILGTDLVTFLKSRRLNKKQKCMPGQVYCVRCRAPRSPAGGMADFQPATGSLGNLMGICPECESMMFRRINLTKLDDVRGNLEIRLPVAL